MKYYLLVISLTCMLSLNSFAQQAPTNLIPNPPVNMEMLVGDRGLSYQAIINKKFQSVPRLGVFSVMNFQTDWKSSEMNDYMIQGNLTFNIIKGLDISSGFIWVPFQGIRPSAGIMYTYANREWLVVANPRVDLHKKTNGEILALVEYKPQLNEKLKLYTRAQALYTQNLPDDYHARSYVMLRAGVTFKDVTFGVGGNLDYYGPQKMRDHNIGGFVNFNLF